MFFTSLQFTILFLQRKLQTYFKQITDTVTHQKKNVFNVLMLLCFFGKYLSLPFSTSNELDSFKIKAVSKKQPKDKACIYFVFKCPWWQDLNNLVKAPAMLCLSNMIFFCDLTIAWFFLQITLDIKIDCKFIVI